MSKSEIQAVYEQHSAEKHRATRPEYIYGPDGELEAFAVCVRSDLPDVVYRLSYPTARRWADGQVAKIPWTEDRLRDGLSRTMRQIRDIYGGEWILDIHYHRCPIIRSGRTPGARAVAEQRILSGPDTPARRFLERQRATGDVGADAYREHLEVEAKARQQIRKGDQPGASKETLPELAKGQSRDQAGKLVGVSGRTMDKAVQELVR